MPIPFYGELGSVNPAVVLPGAAAARAAETATGYAGSLTLGAGQFCTNPGLLFVPDDEGLRTAIADAVQATSGRPDAVRADPRGVRGGRRRAGREPRGHPAGHRAAR